ncbi:MAG: phosphate regulon transcriptional regulator PhoB [Xanthomonadaceae bacterium]|jgi:two-component system phosphate regulon response regulator PhoB|nr:phosphate regulon transcriptional regulator PhoB [Xanthomonadaceae bacterium]
MQARILIVEDESSIAELIAVNLRHAGYDYVIADDVDMAIAEVERLLPDMVLLDWMLPGGSGLSLARRWRSNPRTAQLPIILLTARGDEPDKVAGLDAGADDYIVKPFSVQEMLARIRALLRRKKPECSQDSVTISGLRLDPATYAVSYGDTPLKLGPTEFRLLHYLMRHPNRIHNRRQLLDKVWGDHVFIEERTVDVHIKRLRESLSTARCEQLIETVRGAGYRLCAPSKPDDGL